MKKKNHLLIALSLTVTSFFHSNHSYSQVRFGVKSGINIATTRDLIAYPRNRLAWYAGGLAKIPISKKFFLQTELLYSTKGNRSYNQVGPLKIVTRLNYLNVPILLGYKIDQKTSLLFGPELGYMTSAHIALSNGENFNESNSYHPKFDMGLSIGLNYRIVNDVGFEVRYNYGFKTFYYIDRSGVRHDETKAGNRVFQIGVNYLLHK